ncbi:response regulator [bacterium]|nr:response regulator [FCB group bacterium]MBL7191828.1 response regulator [bacterium]
MPEKAVILVIDDEADVLRYLSVVLMDEGYEVLNAKNNAEALDILNSQIPDLICLDIMMPHESGFNLYRKLKTDEKFSRIPALIVSAVEKEKDFNFRDYIEDENIPSPSGYVEKPIVVDHFLSAVKNALKP